MARLRDSILANYGGQAWIALMGLAFVPVYVGRLGAESFGLVGFMLGLQSLSLLLDFGTGVFLSREIARRHHDPARQGSIRQLVRSFEWLVWPVALCIGLAICLSAPAIATGWLNAETLGRPTLVDAVVLIGLAVALLWPSSFYAAAMTGLEQQPRSNALAAAFSTLRYAGVLPVLYFTDTGILGFLAWFVLVAALQTAGFAVAAWRRLPAAPEPARFRFSELFDAHRFALGVFAATALSLLLTQVDRFTLSALRPLQELGLYTVALTVTAGLGRLLQPMFSAIYPRMSRLVAQGDVATLSGLYHLSSQCVAVVAAAVGGVIVAYPEDLLRMWTGDAALSARIALPLAMLTAGSVLNGLMIVPYALQLAHGSARLAIIANALALALGIPYCLHAVDGYGLAGAASLWLFANLAYCALFVPAMHRRMLPGEAARWYLRDLLPALLAAGVLVAAAKALRPTLEQTAADLAWLFATALLAVCAAGLAAPDVRALVRTQAQRLRARSAE
ncbi:lipopolysaccharide biosynthesis protein [Arenimonas terrae]|jgi:O-antigen/teichoic acid export membrane protein|uniref:Polysaccharide biosynthesis protein n=1 Tax=Arenimonas terrae TaxID=2546226 RepID=A0A5C4RXS3_9GAMM|nr:oligosaccharide flippase family protein [Arenimonas terrae]TNJ35497.1 hypothetical protein E1B00_07015 [Arenimonas terrae]